MSKRNRKEKPMTQPVQTTTESAPAVKNGNGNGSGHGSGPVVPAASQPPALYLTIDRIHVDETFNVRKIYNIDDLVDSLKATKKLLTPLGVRETSPGVFELNEGFRRMRALKALNWTEPVPVVIRRHETRASALLDNLIENVNREDVRPFDLAKRYVELVDLEKVTPLSISKAVGKTKGYVNQLVKIMRDLDPRILGVWSDPAKAVDIPIMTLYGWSQLPHDEQYAKFVADYPQSDPSDPSEEGAGGAAPAPAPEPPATRLKALPAKEIQSKLDWLRTCQSIKGNRSPDKAAILNAYISALQYTLGDKDVALFQGFNQPPPPPPNPQAPPADITTPGVAAAATGASATPPRAGKRGK